MAATMDIELVDQLGGKMACGKVVRKAYCVVDKKVDWMEYEWVGNWVASKASMQAVEKVLEMAG
jgi:hypothetical protein